MCISDYRNWQENDYIKLVKVKNKTYGDEACLEIKLDIEVDYSHLADALYAMHIQFNTALN